MWKCWACIGRQWKSQPGPAPRLTFFGFCLMLKPFCDLMRRKPLRMQSADSDMVFCCSFSTKIKTTKLLVKAHRQITFVTIYRWTQDLWILLTMFQGLYRAAALLIWWNLKLKKIFRWFWDFLAVSARFTAEICYNYSKFEFLESVEMLKFPKKCPRSGKSAEILTFIRFFNEFDFYQLWLIKRNTKKAEDGVLLTGTLAIPTVFPSTTEQPAWNSPHSVFVITTPFHNLFGSCSGSFNDQHKNFNIPR